MFPGLRINPLFCALAALVLLPPLVAASDQRCVPAEALPSTIKAMRMHAYGGPEQLQLEDIERPQPAADEILIQVDSASVNPVDWKLREGWLKDWWPLTLPAVPGRDGSGTVVALGAKVSGWHCGDSVVFVTAEDSGALAEYVVVAQDRVAPKPARLSMVEAAAYPLVGLTAWDGLVGTGAVKAGERVLIQGGAGGVGSMAIQIAKARGAYVITTASGRNHDFVKSLGADEVIDYTQTRFEEAVHDVDLVFDTVGGDTLARSPGVLVAGGRLVSIAGRISEQACTRAGIVCPAEKDGAPGAGLRELQRLIDAGALKVHIDAEYPLADTAAAQERNRKGHTRGKIVIHVAAAES
jgi:NADPH:quinone reductase-like Zn-dependent oxidoreductase